MDHHAEEKPDLSLLRMEQTKNSNKLQNYFQILIIRLLHWGPIPKHIAFIMDGNRRYARETLQKDTKEGYKLGEEAILKLILWLPHINVEEMSVFAFSVENFKRPKQEVEHLLNLFHNIIWQLTYISKYHPESIYNTIQVRFYGKIELFPEKLQSIIKKYNEVGPKNAKKFLNVCAPYTSRFELARAVDILSEFTIKNNLQPEEISNEMIEDTFYTSQGKYPELLVRTSGEIRFSDFMMPQLSFCGLRFIEKMWPEISTIDLLKYVAFYQYSLWYNKLGQTYSNLISSFRNESKIKTLCLEQMKKICLIQMPLPAFE